MFPFFISILFLSATWWTWQNSYYCKWVIWVSHFVCTLKEHFTVVLRKCLKKPDIITRIYFIQMKIGILRNNKLYIFSSQPHCLFLGQQPNAGHGRLILEVSRLHTQVGRTPLDEGSARRWHLYVTTHNTHKGQTSMSPAGFLFCVLYLYFFVLIVVTLLLSLLYNTHNTNIHAPAGFEPAIPASERP